METIQQNTSTGTIADRIAQLEKEKIELESKNEKPFKIPFKWNFRIVQSRTLKNADKILVMLFNKKNQIEPPKLMTISGNIIVYKDCVYKYNPKAIWTFMIRGKPQIYCIREIDMEPISNLDINKIKQEERSTEYHKLLLKAALAAQIQPAKKPVNWMVVGIVLILVVGGLLWFFMK